MYVVVARMMITVVINTPFSFQVNLFSWMKSPQKPLFEIKKKKLSPHEPTPNPNPVQFSYGNLEFHCRKTCASSELDSMQLILYNLTEKIFYLRMVMIIVYALRFHAAWRLKTTVNWLKKYIQHVALEM